MSSTRNPIPRSHCQIPHQALQAASANPSVARRNPSMAASPRADVAAAAARGLRDSGVTESGRRGAAARGLRDGGSGFAIASRGGSAGRGAGLPQRRCEARGRPLTLAPQHPGVRICNGEHSSPRRHLRSTIHVHPAPGTSPNPSTPSHLHPQMDLICLLSP
jgi:hypothetical protein